MGVWEIKSAENIQVESKIESIDFYLRESQRVISKLVNMEKPSQQYLAKYTCHIVQPT